MFIIEIILALILLSLGITSTFIESGTLFSLVVGGSIILLGFIFKLGIINFLSANYMYFVIGGFLYFIVGSIWSIFKWYILNINIRNFYKDHIDIFNKNRSTFTMELRKYTLNDDVTFPPKAKNMKSSILLWISAWPFSIVSYLLGDLVIDICNFIYKKLSGVYGKITDNIFKDIDT